MPRVVLAAAVLCLAATACGGDGLPGSTPVARAVADTATALQPTPTLTAATTQRSAPDAPAPESASTPSPIPPAETPALPSATPISSTNTPSPPTPALELPTAAAAPGFPTVKGNVNVRSGPGTNYSVNAQAGSRDPVQIIAANTAGDWLQVRLPDGKLGWMAAFLIDGVPEDVPLAEEIPPPTTPVPAPATPEPVGARIVIVTVYNSHSVEYVDIANQGDSDADIGRWHLYGSRDHDSSRDDYYFPPGFKLGPGEFVRLHSGDKSTYTSGNDIHWSDQPVRNNTGETVFLEDATGTMVAEYDY